MTQLLAELIEEAKASNRAVYLHLKNQNCALENPFLFVRGFHDWIRIKGGLFEEHIVPLNEVTHFFIGLPPSEQEGK